MTVPDPAIDNPRRPATELVDRYEVLRTSALTRQMSASRDGLAVLLRSGLPAWIKAWSTWATPEPERVPPPVQRPSCWVDEVNEQLVQILAAMALSHLHVGGA